MQRTRTHQATIVLHAALPTTQVGMTVRHPQPPSALDSLPQRIVSTRREWMREPTLYDRLHGGANDSGIHLDDSSEYPAHSAASRLSKSVKSSSTISLPSHAQAALPIGRISIPANAADQSDSGYNSPERPSSTVGAFPSDSMPPSTTSPSYSSAQSEQSTPSLSYTSTATYYSYETASDRRPIIVGTALLEPDGQVLDPSAGARFTGATPHTQQMNTRINLPCVFEFLNCSFYTDSRQTWLAHCSIHFGNKPFPRTTVCPFCSSKFQMIPETETTSAVTAWQQRMECMYHHLKYQNASMSQCRPDLGLFRHLFSHDLISSNDWVELKQDYRLAPERGPVAVYEGPSRRRAERPQRRPQPLTTWQTGYGSSR